MAFTTQAFDRRIAAFVRAEAGRLGRPLGDCRLARVALARRIDSGSVAPAMDPAQLSAGGGFLLRR